MAYKSAKCYVCRDTGPSQSHHLIPLEYGGPKDGPQIDICPRCHLVCHYEAEAVYKTSEYLQLDATYPDLKAYERAEEVINLIVRARLQFEDKGVAAEDARRRVSFSCSSDELLLLHSLKKSAGFKSLERFLKAVVVNYAVSKRRGK
jgi:hypothetical protein